ncbi:MAG: hypothetical protein FIB03_05405, partial [Anaerolineae bacterium]|nr:hypothetical protein [Anaerolineae bacterium]
MNGKIGLRIVSALVLIAAVAGIGFFAFRAGVAQGSPVTITAPSGESVPAPYPYYGYGYGLRFHHPFGFGLGCFGILIPLFLFFLALKAFRFAFWGPRWGWGGHPGHWGRRWEGGVPPKFDEWH